MNSTDSITIVELPRPTERERLPILCADCLEVFLDEVAFAMHAPACARVSAPRRA